MDLSMIAKYHQLHWEQAVEYTHGTLATRDIKLYPGTESWESEVLLVHDIDNRSREFTNIDNLGHISHTWLQQSWRVVGKIFKLILDFKAKVR